MNIIKDKLNRILGTKLPKTAHTFCTVNGFAWFTTREGKMLERKLSKKQIDLLKKENLLGSLGWTL